MVFFPLVNLWDKKSLVLDFAILNIKLRYKSTFLGLLWTAIVPMMYFIVLYTVFSTIRVTEENFAIYLITGVMFFHIFASGTSSGLGSLISNDRIILASNIRTEFFPVVSSVAIGFLAFVDIGVFFALMPIFQFIPSWTIILLPIPLILLFFLILGLSYFLSVAAVYVRDIQHFWGIFSHSLLFVSPIFWNVKNVDGILLQIQAINPLGQIIEIAHIIVIDGQIPASGDLLYTTIFVAAIFFLGYLIFHKFERSISEVV